VGAVTGGRGLGTNHEPYSNPSPKNGGGAQHGRFIDGSGRDIRLYVLPDDRRVRWENGHPAPSAEGNGVVQQEDIQPYVPTTDSAAGSSPDARERDLEGEGRLSHITVIPLDDVPEIPLPNGSWSKMALTAETAPGIVSSLGYSVFTPGTELAMVSHEVEEVAFVVAGSGELRTDDGAVPFAAGQAIHIPPRLWHAVANTGSEDVIMVFGFPHPVYPPTERR
jgi:mannose-6-phosphate isomerase-like protein (cupin superfamily)